MLFNLSLLAIALPLVSALQLSIPSNPTSSGTVTIKWTNEQGDPDTWSFELINTAFNNAFAIANNINPSASSITITLPVVPVGDGYTLQAVNIGNITDVFASTGDFAIGAATTTSTTASSTSSTSTTSSGTGTKSGSTTASTPALTTPGFTSVIQSATTPTGSATTTPVSSTDAPATTGGSTNFNSGVSLSGSGYAAVLLSLGAAMLAL